MRFYNGLKKHIKGKERQSCRRKKPFITLAQAKEIAADIPTPFHLYDEKGIRENARRVIAAFSWNKGFKEYFAVKATPNPTCSRSCRRRAAALTAPAILSCS